VAVIFAKIFCAANAELPVEAACSTKTVDLRAITAYKILAKITATDEKKVLQYDSYHFCYVAAGGITFMCMTEKDLGTRIPFAFLENVREDFASKCGDRAKTSVAFGLTDEFGPTLQQLMTYYSEDPNVERLARVQRQAEEVKQIMVENIERVLDRGEKLDLLVDRTDQLSRTSADFRKKATTLRRETCMQKYKLYLIVTLVTLFLLLILILSICGITFKKCGAGANKPKA